MFLMPFAHLKIMGKEEIVHKKAKGLVSRQGNYVIFVTPEAKMLGWGSDTVIKVSVVKDGKERWLKIEKVADL